MITLRNEFMTNREVSGLDTIHLLSAPDDYIFYKEKTPVKNEPENPDNIYEYIEGYVLEDIQPYYTDSVYTYYKGTYIIGTRFDGFTGKNPTVFDSPSRFYVNSVVTGWSEMLQRMKVPEVMENVTTPDQYELLEMSKISGFVDRARGTGRPTKKDRRSIEEFTTPEFLDDFEFDFDFEEE